MNLKDLIPSSEQWKQLQDAESALIRRRSAGTIAGVVAVVTAILQLALVLEDKGYLDSVLSILSSLVRLRFDELANVSIDTHKLIGWVVLSAAVGIYFLLRRTGLLLKESQEPFRYTFWIKQFDQIDSTPDKRFDLKGADRFVLLHHDLTARLNQRIRRFSILENAESSSDGDVDKPIMSARQSSHIHISGNWVVREDSNGKWVLQVTPSVRIGAEGSPAKLTTPIMYSLDKIDSFLKANESEEPSISNENVNSSNTDSGIPAADKAREPIGYDLSAGEYIRITERVYSQIATEVYGQIDSDVRKKIELFPTARLRALALYYEAEDFANSNTVDAYQRAIDLYRDAMRYFETVRLRQLTEVVLHFPWLLWRIDVNFHNHWAAMVAGYAKCLIYRREISSLAGRSKNALYELTELVGSTIADLEVLYQKIGMAKGVGRLNFLMAAFHYPNDSWITRFSGRAYAATFEDQKKCLADLYLVDGLAGYAMGSIDRTEKRLQDALSVSPNRVTKDPLYALMLGLVEPASDKSIVHHRQAVELAPDFLMAGWYLATAYEAEFRRRDVITEERANQVIVRYEDLLKINYGTVAALSAQGYMQWLIKSESAKNKFEEGREMKVIERQTFVGVLDYRLARVAAEAGEYDQCFSHYMEAKEADSSIGSFLPGQSIRIDMSDFHDIGPEMLKRFKDYSQAVVDSIDSCRKKQDGDRPFSDTTLNTVKCFVLNDYGNACLKFFHYHGDLGMLDTAIDAYEQAINTNPKDAVPWFNVQNAYGWAGQREKIPDCYNQARKLAPAWSSVAIAAAQENVRTISEEQRRNEEKIEESNKRVTWLKDYIEKDESEINGIRTLKVLKSIGSRQFAEMQDFSVNARIAPEFRSSIDTTKSSRESDTEATRRELFEREQVLSQGVNKLKVQLVEANKNHARLLAEGMSLAAKFKESHESALRIISSSSRLEPLFHGEVEERIPRIIAIPVQRFNEDDVGVLIARAQVLALAIENQSYLQASMLLAEHLIKIVPGNSDVIFVLLDVIQRLIKNEESKGVNCNKRNLNNLKERLVKTNTIWEKTVERWIRFNSNQFLALYWYLSTVDYGDTELLNRIREDYFKGDSYQFEVLLGHVYFRLWKPTEAVKAYDRSLKLNPEDSRQHYYLGRVHEAQGDWNAARSAYADAYRLDPTESEYANRVAGAYNNIGEQFEDAGSYDDAVDNYRQAITLSPNNGLFQSNLSSAWEMIEKASRGDGYGRAIEAMENANKIDPINDEYRENLERLKRKQAALDVYGTAASMDFLTVVTPVAIEYSENLSGLIRGDEIGEVSIMTDEKVASMRDDLQDKFGIYVPNVRWRANSTDLADGTYILMLSEIPLASGNVSTQEMMCLRNVDDLKQLGISGESVVDPLTDNEAAWIKEEEWEIAKEAEIELIDSLGYILRHLQNLISKNLVELLGQQEVDSLMRYSGDNRISMLADDLTIVDQLTDITRALVTERVPITAFIEIVHKFLELRDSEATENIIVKIRSLEQVRKQLPGNSKDDTVLSLGPKFEELIENSMFESGDIHGLAMEPEDCQEVLTLIRNEINTIVRPALVVNKPIIRIHLRNLVELEFPDMPVLAKDELLEEVKIADSPVIELEDLD